MRVTLPLVSLAVVVAAAAACGRSGVQVPGGDGVSGPVPIPTFLQPADYGNGKDGDLVVSIAGQAVNGCAELVRTTAGGVVVSGTGAQLQAGDRVLLWQVQAVFASNGTAAPIATLESAGAWQITTVAGDGMSGSFVPVSPGPSFAFHSDAGAAAAQACRIPQFRDVVVDSGASLSATAWDGRSGGFAGFYASGTLEIRSGGAIDATSKGFAGGSFGPSGVEGTRGEGVDLSAHDVTTRQNLANAAGGGGLGNCGGAGGGNGGRGGSGGGSSAACYGQAGNEVTVSATNAFVMGAGGGSGQGGSGGQGPGGAGGGVVFFRVRTLIGAGGASADGVGGGIGSFDGAGGGGAGGLLFLSAGSSEESSGLFTARGATGGGASIGHGPGGGGGGGRAWVEGIAASSTIVTGASSGTDGSGPLGSTTGSDGVAESSPTQARILRSQ